MKFRTEIDIRPGHLSISHDDRIVLLGSCFTDHIGQRLERDGFNVTYNPMGPLYNPASLARLLSDLLSDRIYTASDFMTDDVGINHCLDFASRYQNADSALLAKKLNREITELRTALENAGVLIITFGSSVVYSLTDGVEGTVGNCHKFPTAMFKRLSLEVNDIVELWRPLLERLTAIGKTVIFTVSPIRHLADGLHGNELSKARLLLACDSLSSLSDYFPSYEIMIDDLRDYRFYNTDLKHPTDMACDYIYEKFAARYFTKPTLGRAAKEREAFLRSSHRSIISNNEESSI